MPRPRVAALVALAMAPAACELQDPDLLARLRAAAVDSLPGPVPVYYSQGHVDRARRLQQEHAAAVEYYGEALAGAPALNVSTGLALLDRGDWSEVAGRPYGLPHIDFTAWPVFVVFLPAANDEGFAAELWERAGLASRVDITRVVDVIGRHEFGHALNVRYLYVLAPGVESLSVQWFDEFMATYFGQGHLWHTQGFDADPIEPRLISDTIPRYTTLREFEEQRAYFGTPEGFANYAWYQAQFAGRAREVFQKQGVDFIRRVREELPWDTYSSWTVDDLLTWLERIEPGFVAWASSLERAGR